jgi:hypothetical protein
MNHQRQWGEKMKNGETHSEPTPGRQRETPAEVDAGFQKADRLGALVVSLPKWTAYAIIAWQAALSVEALSGKNAIASLLIRFGREASFWEVVCWAAALLGILYGLYNRHLLRRQITKESLRMQSVERQIRTLYGLESRTGNAATETAGKD